MSFGQKNSSTNRCAGTDISGGNDGHPIARSKTIHAAAYSPTITVRQYNNKANALRFSALRPHNNLNSINSLLVATGGVAPRSPALPKPGHHLSSSQQLLAAFHLAARRSSGKKTVVGAKRRPRTGQRAGRLSQRDHMGRRAGERQRSLTVAPMWERAAGAKRRELNRAHSRPAAQQLLTTLIQPIKRRAASLSATAICSLALLIAQTGTLAAPASIADAPALNSTAHVCQPTISVQADESETATTPDLTSAKSDHPPIRSRLLPSHVASAA